MIEVVCPWCRKSLSASEKLAGKKVRSRVMGKLFFGTQPRRTDRAELPPAVESAPGRWQETVVPLGPTGSLDVVAKGFGDGDMLYVDEVRILEK